MNNYEIYFEVDKASSSYCLYYNSFTSKHAILFTTLSCDSVNVYIFEAIGFVQVFCICNITILWFLLFSYDLTRCFLSQLMHKFNANMYIPHLPVEVPSWTQTWLSMQSSFASQDMTNV